MDSVSKSFHISGTYFNYCECSVYLELDGRWGEGPSVTGIDLILVNQDEKVKVKMLNGGSGPEIVEIIPLSGYRDILCTASLVIQLFKVIKMEDCLPDMILNCK
jgi:hypothetical protein